MCNVSNKVSCGLSEAREIKASTLANPVSISAYSLSDLLVFSFARDFM